MAEILVRNLDEAVVEQLESCARNNGRSLQDELELMPEASARLSRAAYRALADEVRAGVGDRLQGDSAALLAEDRAR